MQLLVSQGQIISTDLLLYGWTDGLTNEILILILLVYVQM